MKTVGPSTPSIPAVIESTHEPLPPPYFEVVNDKILQEIPGGVRIEPPETLLRDISSYQNVDATKCVPFNPSMFICTENINSSSLRITSDPNPSAPNTVKIIADINIHGETEFNVAYHKSIWSNNPNQIHCQFTVMFPSNFNAGNSGLSADIYNMYFKYLNLKPTQQETKLTNIRTDTLSITSNVANTCKKLRVQSSVILKSTS